MTKGDPSSTLRGGQCSRRSWTTEASGAQQPTARCQLLKITKHYLFTFLNQSIKNNHSKSAGGGSLKLLFMVLSPSLQAVDCCQDGGDLGPKVLFTTMKSLLDNAKKMQIMSALVCSELNFFWQLSEFQQTHGALCPSRHPGCISSTACKKQLEKDASLCKNHTLSDQTK